MNSLIFKKIIAISLSLCIFLPSVSLAQNSINTSAGKITTDGATATGVDKAQNGVPLVNIANPSGAGVSHNKFTDFNVGTEGLILNNNSSMGISLIGGAVYANPNLAPGSQGARVILNEVTSTNASRLLGATEIHGRSAEYILANPNGITCNGCEFINTPRVMLGTGRPEIRGGEFMGIHMDPAGQVFVEGHGLNAGNVDYFDIVTRAAKINADVYANELNIKLGNQYFDYNTREMKSSNDASLTSPHLSLDSTQLGGIDAGRITLESTEKGVGVNMGGQLYSNEDLVVTADGRIEYQSVVSENGGVQVRSEGGGIVQQGYTAAEGNITLNSAKGIFLNGSSDDLEGYGMYSKGHVQLNAGREGIENNTGIRSNGQSSLISNGDVTNRGTVLAGTDIYINAANIKNKGIGKIMSYEDVDLNASGNVDLESGELVALGDLSIKAQNDITTNARVHADEVLDLNAKNNFSNSGILTAGTSAKSGDASTGIRLKAETMNNTAASSLLSHGNLDITVKQNISLVGDLEASGDLNVDSEGNITNMTDIDADRWVNLNTSKDIVNNGIITGGVVGNSNSGIHINSDGFINNGNLDSYANTNVTVAKDLNLTGKVMTYENLNLTSGRNITNKTDLDTGGNTNISAGEDFVNGYVTGSQSHNSKVLSDGNLDISARNITNYGTMETGGDMTLASLENFTNDRMESTSGILDNALLLSAGDMEIQANNITNKTGEIFSMGSITLQKDAAGGTSNVIDNLSGMVGTSYVSAVIEADRDLSIRANTLNNMSYDYDPDLGGAHGYNISYDEPRGLIGTGVWALMSEDVAHSTLKSIPSFITAGKDIHITGADITNQSSSLSAVGDITITGGSVNNIHSYVVAKNLRRKFGKHTHWTTGCGPFGGCTHHNTYEYEDRLYDANMHSDKSSNLHALGNVIIDGVTQVTNGTAGTNHAKAVNTASLDAARASGIIPTFGELDSNRLFNLSALFGLSENPQGRYLIESRSRFTNIDGLLGSAYFLNRIGYNPHTDLKLLGDDYYQARLIERSILEATGKRYLSKGVGSDLDQLERLYNNAYEESEDHDLMVGVALSSDQIRDLKKDIVWLVEREVEVDGRLHKVLVPQVYLARATREALEDPESVIEGFNVAINSTEDIENSGKISAENNLRLASSKGIHNTEGFLTAGQNSELFAGEDILNTGGRIQSGKDMILSAGGNITSSNVKVREGTDGNFYDKITAQGSIESGEEAVLLAGKDINISGTRLKAGRDLSLMASGDVKIEAEEIKTRDSMEAWGDNAHKSVKETTRHQLADLSSGGDMSISAGKDMEAIGANLAAEGNMDLSAGEDLTIASVQDRDYSYHRSTEKKSMSSQDNTDIRENSRNVSSNVNTDGNFSSTSGKDTTILASNITAVGDGNINADGDLNILSGTDENYRFSETKKTRKSLRGMKESHRYEDYDATQKESNLNFGGNASLTGDKSVLIAASNVNSGVDMNLTSDGDITVASAEEVSNRKEAHMKASFDSANVKFNRSSVDFNWSQEVKENEKEVDKVTQKQSNLAAGGNMSINSGGDTNIVSSNLMAGEKVAISAGKDVNFLTAKETEKITEKERSIKNTFTKSYGNSWVEAGYAAHDAAKMLKEVSQADNSGTTSGAINTAISAAKAAISGYLLAKTVQAVANSAKTAGTYGFHDSLSVTQEIETNASSSEKSTELGSTVLANDMNIIANNDIKAKGVSLVADGGDISLKAGNNVNIESGENTTKSGTSREYKKLQTILKSSNGDYIPTATTEHSESSDASTTQINSQLAAKTGTIKIESGADTDLVGVNVKAKDIDMTGIKGDLTLASKQDSSESSSSHYSLTLGRENVGFSIGESKAKENWTNSQSSIIGTDSVQIKAKNLNLEGSIIANQKEDGTDGGNMDIDVENINTTDLKDTSESESYSFGIGTSWGGPKDGENKKNKTWKEGNTNVSFANGGHDKEGMTRATLGNGNIHNNSNAIDIGEINRDLSQTQVVTKDEKRGGIDVSMDFSNEVIADVASEGLVDGSKKHLKDAAKTFSDLPKNLVLAGKRVGKAFKDVGETANLTFKGKTGGIAGTAEQYNLRVADNEAYARMTSEQRDVMENPQNYGVDEKRHALNAYNNTFALVLGIDPADAHIYSAKLIKAEKALAKNGSQANIDKRKLIAATDADPTKKDNYFEADRINEDDNISRAAGHEGARYLNIQKGKTNSTSPDGVSGDQDFLARKMGDHSTNALGFERSLQKDADDGTFSKTAHVRTEEDMAHIMEGTDRFNKVDRLEPMAPGLSINAPVQMNSRIPSYNISGIQLANINKDKNSKKNKSSFIDSLAENVKKSAKRIKDGFDKIMSSPEKENKIISDELQQGNTPFPIAEPDPTTYVTPTADPGSTTFETPAADPGSTMFETPAIDPGHTVFDTPMAEPGETILARDSNPQPVTVKISSNKESSKYLTDRTNKNNVSHGLNKNVIDGTTYEVDLPADLNETFDRINKGNKYPHKNDGSIFINKESLLPSKPMGYYKEYVHPTKGEKRAGIQRIVIGKNGETYYTPDHYKSFKKVK